MIVIEQVLSYWSGKCC